MIAYECRSLLKLLSFQNISGSTLSWESCFEEDHIRACDTRVPSRLTEVEADGYDNGKFYTDIYQRIENQTRYGKFKDNEEIYQQI